MGYRSDVVIAVTKVAYTKSILKQDLPDMLKGNDSWVVQKDNDMGFFWTIEGIKWYESYPEVQEVMDWLTTIESEEHQSDCMVNGNKQKPWEQDQYGFLRMGEEYNDIEELGDPYHFDISMCREIVTPFS